MRRYAIRLGAGYEDPKESVDTQIYLLPTIMVETKKCTGDRVHGKVYTIGVTFLKWFACIHWMVADFN